MDFSLSEEKTKALLAIPHTPSYVIDEEKLYENLRLLRDLQDDTGCRILLAQKAFSAYFLYPEMKKYIAGTTASGMYEARLGYENMGGEVHVFSPAYSAEEMEYLAKTADHIVFNSFSQLEAFKGKTGKASIGLRINPEFSTQTGHEIYDPCAKGSRLGIPMHTLPESLPDCVEGLHIHTLCEQDSDALVATFAAFERGCGKFFGKLKWLNLGGGHHITRPGYDIDSLKKLILRIKSDYGVEVYLEPGEAVALNAGYLVSSVMDIVENEDRIAILDTSAACHMPDVLEMPYRPPLVFSGMPDEKRYTYTLSSRTCLAGDVIGKYSFSSPLNTSDRLIFGDMAIYSMVKNNTFNGMPLPSIYVLDRKNNLRLQKQFEYSDFVGRLG